MKERRKATRSSRIITILLIVFLIADYFLLKHCKESGKALTMLIIWGIFTIFLGYGLVYNLKKESKLKQAINLKERGLAQPIKTKIIRFDFEAGIGSGLGYYHIITSNGQTEFSSESIKGKIVGYNPMELTNLSTIGLKYNIMDIEPAIQELEQIKTAEDVQRHIENNSNFVGYTFNALHKITGGFYEAILQKINECKEYLKEISKIPKFKNFYLKHKNYQIHIGDNITVYVNPNDSTVYQVDTNFLYN